MALADHTITVNAVPHSLVRTGSGMDQGVFKTNDGTVSTEIRHQYGRRTRRTFRLNLSKIAADPLTSDNVRYSMSTYIVIDTPVDGFTVTEAKQVVDGLLAHLTAGSGAVITKVLGGES